MQDRPEHLLRGQEAAAVGPIGARRVLKVEITRVWGRQPRGLRGRQGLDPAEPGRHPGGPLHGRAVDARPGPVRGRRGRAYKVTTRTDERQRRRTTWSSGSSTRRYRTGCGSPTSPTSRPTPAGSTQRSSSTCFRRMVVGWQISEQTALRPGHRRPGDGHVEPHATTARSSTAWSITATEACSTWQFATRSVSPRTTSSPRSDQPGDSYDNAMAEAFNRLYKGELIYHQGPVEGDRRRRDRHRGLHRLVQPPQAPRRDHRRQLLRHPCRV